MDNEKQNKFLCVWNGFRKEVKHIFPNFGTEAAIIIIVLALAITAMCVMRTTSSSMQDSGDNMISTQKPVDQQQGGTPEFEVSGTNPTNPQSYTITYQTSQMCFIGDSRTVAMQGSIVTDARFIAKSSMGLDWFNNTAAQEFDKIKDDIEICIVALGINDIKNVDAYIQRLNSFANQYPNKVFVYVNIGPVDETLYTGIPNSSLQTFNQKMEEGLSDRWQIVDQFTYLSNETFKSSDGLHYSFQDSAKVFAWIVDSVKTQTVTMAQ